MCERFGDGHLLELGPGASAERATGGCEDEGLDRLGLATLEALEERRVLAVDRKQQSAAAAMGRDGELAGGDQALLVRECERDAVLERPQRRLDAREAHDRVQHDVRLAGIEERRRMAPDLDMLDAVGLREVVERLRAGHEGTQFELSALLDDADRLATDRAGGTEQGDALRLHETRVPDAPVVT